MFKCFPLASSSILLEKYENMLLSSAMMILINPLNTILKRHPDRSRLFKFPMLHKDTKTFAFRLCNGMLTGTSNMFSNCAAKLIRNNLHL